MQGREREKDAPLLLRALRRESAPRPPVWVMRQAGRYLPEYRALRKQCGSFLALMKNPQAACEAAAQPLARFSLDAAIVFSDILTVPDAMGLGLNFAEGEGPHFKNPVQDEAAVAALRPLPEGALDYVFEACALTKRAVNVPLIGFCGSPFTLACYMVEGRGGEFWTARKMMHARADLFLQVVNKTADALPDYLAGQARAGADALMIFDSWGGLLPPALYEQFSLAPMRRVIAALREKTDAPVIVFSRGRGLQLKGLAACGANALGIDWQVGLDAARRAAGKNIALQGNLDPAVLLADAAAVRRETLRVMAAHGGARGHIFNLGHGIDRRTPPDNVKVMIDAVHEFSHGGGD